MDESRGERYGSLGGVIFVVLDVVVAVIGGEPPPADASPTKVAAYYVSKSSAIEAGLWLFGLAAVALMWWSGSLWRRMARLEGGAPRLAVVSVLGLGVAGALSLASAAVSAAAASRVAEAGDQLAVFHTVATMLLAASGFGVATHLLAASRLGAGTKSMATWVAAIGVMSAVAFLISSVVGIVATSDVSEWAGVLGFALWSVWILAVSVRMWRDSAAMSASSSAPLVPTAV